MIAILQGDARHLPLPDGCVDLVCCSPPYFGLRDYGYDGQIGSEATPQEWVAAMVECTREMMRVLKPEGSIFINLGDKYNSAASGQKGTMANGYRWQADTQGRRYPALPEAQPKSLLGLPWRYALACTDQLGLILRRDIIWAKPNGLPESVTDRCRSAHEYVFHLVRQPRYYSAVDEIREPHATNLPVVDKSARSRHRLEATARPYGIKDEYGSLGYSALGKLPGSVWTIPSQPLTVPASVGVDHFAAFPVELPRRIVLGWSPPGVCVACGQGRRPVVDRDLVATRGTVGLHRGQGRADRSDAGSSYNWTGSVYGGYHATITGYVCACAPYTDHPERRGHSWHPHDADGTRGARTTGPERPSGPREAVREYHLDGWTPPPTRPAVVLDPFAGTGTTLLAAAAYGRHAIGIDRSADYCRLARWRVNDPGERAKAMQVPKPPPVPDGMEALF